MNSAIIVAAGKGLRVGKKIPKQFLKIRGKEILQYSVETFLSHPKINEVIIVSHTDWLDKVSKKYLITLFLVLQGISTFVLAFASGLGFAILFAILYGIAFGGRIPLMTSIRGEYFGRKAFATIMGWSMLPNGILMAIAPVWAGWMFDSYGSYTIPFVTYATLSIIGSVIMLFARKPNMIR